ncbi:MAG: GAF domain-containing protein, partial [Candidatus Hodarchaeota archaeon]
PIKLDIGTGLTGYIAAKKEVFNIYGDELRNHPATKDKDTSFFLPSQKSYSTLAYPIIDENKKLVGLLIAYNKLDEKGKPLITSGFSKEFDEPLMRILTTKLLISIKNAQLINQLSNSLNQLKNYELIVENTPDPVVITTRHGVITYMNEGAINLFGNLIGEKVSDYYYSDEMMTSLDRAKEIMSKLYETEDGLIKNVETIFTSKDGHPIPVSLSASLLMDDKSEIIGTIGISKDLREIKTLLEVGNSLLSTHDTNEILKKICDECIKLPKSNRAYIKLYDEKSDCLYFRELSSRNSKDELPKEPSPKDRGMTGFVFMRQEYYLSGDVTKEPSGRFHRLFPDVNSKLVVPISSVDKATRNIKRFGVISVDSNEKHAFTVNDIHFLSTLANQAANALENANLIAYKDKIINELSALEKVRKTITETSNFEEILESLLDSVTDTLGFDYATISEVKKDSGMIGTVRSRNVPDGWVEDAWHSLDSNDIQAWVVRNKKEEKLDGWDDRIDKMMYDKYRQEKLVRIYIPIITRGEVLGTLETGYYKTHKADIEPEEIEILRKVVNLAGLGIEQVNLIKEQANLVEQLQALNEASIYIQSAKTEEKVVEHIFKSLKRIGYSKGMLSLVNVTTDKIEGRYALGSNWEIILNETKRDLKGNDILAIAIRKRHSILSKDCPFDSSCNPIAIKKAKIKSQYIIPLIVNEKAIGTLQIDLSDKQGLVNGPEDVLNRRLEVLETFASQIAIAISNVRDRKMINLLETTLSETAHEFRSPLHNIITQIGSLKTHLPDDYKNLKEIDEIFKIINEETHRADRQMINTLLSTDKSRGVIEYNFEEDYIQDIIKLSVKSYQLRALERGISIIIRDNIKRLPRFNFDKYKIEQVLNNLLDNAIKYSHYNRYVEIQGYDDGTNIHIDIWDKGLGIPESEFDNIFLGFTRGKYKDKKRYIPGTGLGLKISKEIVEDHGGKIKVKSKSFFDDPEKIREYDGYDTIFTVILPKKHRRK